MWNPSRWRSFMALLLLNLSPLLNLSLANDKVVLINVSKKDVTTICNQPMDNGFALSIIGSKGGDHTVDVPNMDVKYRSSCCACLVRVLDTILDKPIVKLLSLYDANHTVKALTIRAHELAAQIERRVWDETSTTFYVKTVKTNHGWKENSNEQVWPMGSTNPCVANFFRDLNNFLKEMERTPVNDLLRGVSDTDEVALINHTGKDVTAFCGNSLAMIREQEFVIVKDGMRNHKVHRQLYVADACHLKFDLENADAVDITIYTRAPFEILVGTLGSIELTKDGLYYSFMRPHRSYYGDHELQLLWKEQRVGVYPPVPELRTDAARELLEKVFAVKISDNEEETSNHASSPLLHVDQQQQRKSPPPLIHGLQQQHHNFDSILHRQEARNHWELRMQMQLNHLHLELQQMHMMNFQLKSHLLALQRQRQQHHLHITELEESQKILDQELRF